MSPLPIWPSADLLLVNLDLTLPTLGPEPGDETPRMMPLAIDRGMSVRYSGLRLRSVTHSSRMTGRRDLGLGLTCQDAGFRGASKRVLGS